MVPNVKYLLGHETDIVYLIFKCDVDPKRCTVPPSSQGSCIDAWPLTGLGCTF